ncbi:MAG: hypothetical protein LBD28_01660 [Tannerellaceae bacterium]|jgi:hypothetical protein|nr:hypothetical protein [Tannerellaceae bacterium]
MKTKSFLFYVTLIGFFQLVLFSCGGDDNDNLPPGKVVSNLTFTDTDGVELSIGGTLSWDLPEPETNIGWYVIYLGESSTDRTHSLGKAPAGVKFFEVPAGTPWKPYLIVVATNDSGEASTAASVSVTDKLPVIEIVEMHGAYVLNSGNVGENNSSLDFINLVDKSSINGVFLATNQRKLGDLAQDAIIYGQKMYILVSISQTIEVTDLFGVSIKQIKTDGEPRAVTSANGKIFVTLFNGKVISVDTTSLAVDKTVTVGRNPEQIAAVGSKLYVANSGGMDFASPIGYDKTVSVIDIPTFTEIKKIEVVQNPVSLLADKQGDVYVISMGDYSNPPVLQRIAADNETVSIVDGVHPSEMTTNGSRIWFFQYDWSGAVPTVYGIYDAMEEKLIEGSFIKGDAPAMPYKLFIDSDTENIYLTASDYMNNGDLHVFSSAGSLIQTWTVGLNPIKVVFMHTVVVTEKP